MPIDIFVVLKTSYAIYDAAALIRELDDLSSRITNVYKDISDSHFESARQAIRAAKHSKSPDTEIRNAITQLRNAYYIYAKLADQKRGPTLSDIVWTNNPFRRRPVVADTPQFFIDLAHMGALIAMLYGTLDENENADVERTKALADFDRASVALVDMLKLYTVRRSTPEEEKTTTFKYLFVDDKAVSWYGGDSRVPEKYMRALYDKDPNFHLTTEVMDQIIRFISQRRAEFANEMETRKLKWDSGPTLLS